MEGERIIPKVLKVVAVDDSSLIAGRIKSILLGLPYVHFSGHAFNIAEAVTLIGNENPDVVILDINLEGYASEKNGLDLLVTIRKSHPRLKVVMLTNLVGEQYRNACLVLGAEYFLDKSAEFEQLPERLKVLSESF